MNETLLILKQSNDILKMYKISMWNEIISTLNEHDVDYYHMNDIEILITFLSMEESNNVD
jgi:hypothetical protein